MGSISHPWNLVTLFMVTSVAAMVHSAGDMDVGSATGNHPEPRHADTRTNGLQHCTHVNTEQVIESPFLTYENYQICIMMSPLHREEEEGDVWGLIEFESGQAWGGYHFLQKTNTPEDTCRCIEKRAVYYEGDKVEKILINMRNCYGCSWFPRDIVVKIPQRAECYICDRGPQCNNPGEETVSGPHSFGCKVQSDYVEITCALQDNSHRFC